MSSLHIPAFASWRGQIRLITSRSMKTASKEHLPFNTQVYAQLMTMQEKQIFACATRIQKENLIIIIIIIIINNNNNNNVKSLLQNLN